MPYFQCPLAVHEAVVIEVADVPGSEHERRGPAFLRNLGVQLGAQAFETAGGPLAVGQDRHAVRPLDRGEGRQSGSETGAAKRSAGGAIGLVE